MFLGYADNFLWFARTGTMEAAGTEWRRGSAKKGAEVTGSETQKNLALVANTRAWRNSAIHTVATAWSDVRWGQMAMVATHDELVELDNGEVQARRRWWWWWRASRWQGGSDDTLCEVRGGQRRPKKWTRLWSEGGSTLVLVLGCGSLRGRRVRWARGEEGKASGPRNWLIQARETLWEFHRFWRF